MKICNSRLGLWVWRDMICIWTTMKTRTPDLLGMSYACANMVHSPGYADDLRQYTSLNKNLAWSLALGLRNLEPKGPFNLPILKSCLAFWEPNWAYQVFWCMHHSIIWQQIWVWNPNFGWIQAAYGRSGRGSVSQRKPELLRASDSLGILCFATANNLLNLLFAVFLIQLCFSVNCLKLL